MALGWFDTFLGFILIAAFVRVQFDRPCAARTYTSLGWYSLGMLLYAIVPVALFTFASLKLRELSFLMLCTILLIPMVPGFSRAYRWFRRVIHGLVGVPAMAQGLGETLANAEIHVSDRMLEECRSILLRRGFNPDDNWLPAAEPMRDLWLKSFVLFHQVRSWEFQPRYQRFLEIAATDFDVLRHRFDQLSLKTVRVLHTVDRLGVVWNRVADDGSLEADDERKTTADSLRSVVNDVLSDAREDIAFFHRNLCFFVARNILAMTWTKRGRERAAKKLGFKLGSEAPSVPSLLLWAFVCYILVFVGFMVGGGSSPELFRPIMISMIQVAAIALVLYSKKTFGFANEDIHGHPPYGFIVGVGFAAALVTAPIQVLFTWLGLVHDDTPLVSGSPANGALWLIVTAITASTVAFLIQERRWRGVRYPSLQRLCDVLVFGALTIPAVEFVVQLGAPTTLHPLQRRLASTLTAVLVGAIVPYESRRNAGTPLYSWQLLNRQLPSGRNTFPPSSGGTSTPGLPRAKRG
jgi:hypothetical protein